jgi:hypothetical protein
LLCPNLEKIRLDFVFQGIFTVIENSVSLKIEKKPLFLTWKLQEFMEIFAVDMQFTLDPTPLEKLRNLHTLDLNFYDNTQNELFRSLSLIIFFFSLE